MAPKASAAADHHLRDLVRLPKVGARVQRPHAITILDPRADRSDRFGRSEAVQHDVAAGRGKLLRRREAEALGGSGDQRALAFESSCQHVHAQPS